jgi:hypothetical protein
LTVTYVSHSGTITNNDEVFLEASLTGDKGDTGLTGATGPTGSTTFDFVVATSGDPGDGKIGFNSGTLASVTALLIDNENAGAGDVTGWLDSFGDFGDASSRGQLQVYKTSAPTANYLLLNVTGVTDSTGYRTVAVEVLDSAGSFAADDEVTVAFFPRGVTGATGADGADGAPGATGDTGPTGASGVTSSTTFDFSTTLTDADPGEGVLRFNSGTIASATEAYVNIENSGGVDVSGWLDAFATFGNDTEKGLLMVQKSAAPTTVFYIFTMTGVTTATGYRKLALSYIS